MPTIIYKIFVRAFYRGNAGFFMFLFLVFFGVVAPSQQLAYHHSLILGLLQTPVFLFIVLIIWFLYTAKTARFTLAVLEEDQSGFLYVFGEVGARRLFWLCWSIQSMLLLPVWGYSLAVTGVAIGRGEYGMGIFIQVYLALLCGAGAWLVRQKWIWPGHEHKGWPVFAGGTGLVRGWGGLKRRARRLPYSYILLRHLFQEEKALLIGSKLFACSILYLLLREQGDLRMPILFFHLAILGHGALLYRCRLWEDTRLSFYRALPVSLPVRLGQYAVFYLLLLLPEIVVLNWLAPGDMLEFVLTGYGLLLLLNSLLFTASFSSRQFLQLCLGIFGILYCCVLGKCLLLLSGLLLITAAILFFRGYARYERAS